MKRNLILLALGMTACGGIPQQKQADPTQFSDVTDTSKCQLATPAQPTIYGSWRQTLRDGYNNEEDVTVTINTNGTTTYNAVCKWPGIVQTIPSGVVTSSVDSSNAQFFISSTSQEQTPPEVDANGVSRTCAWQMASGSFNYSYAGTCVLLQNTDTGTKFYLVP